MRLIVVVPRNLACRTLSSLRMLTAQYLALRFLLSLTPALTNTDGEPSSLSELYYIYHKDYVKIPDKKYRHQACLELLEHAMPHVMTTAYLEMISENQANENLVSEVSYPIIYSPLRLQILPQVPCAICDYNCSE